MKKLLSIAFTGLTITAMQSQDISDAMRFSQDNLNGTARFRAMSGAFGALGGDLSSIGINPAGSAVFINNQIGFTVSNYHTNNKADYFGTKYSEKNNDFDLSQIGAVFVFDNQGSNNDWGKFSLGVNYENANNFDNKSFIVGNNPTNSIAEYFINQANGIPTNILNLDYNQLNFREQQASLAYGTYLIENTSGTNNYFSNMGGTDNYHQESTMSSSGYNGKLSFNFATQYQDWLYLGLNLNAHFVDYKRSTSFYEDIYNSTTRTPDNGIQDVRYSNDLYTYGNGFSFQLGAIIKPTDEIRLGLSYQSPTWYRLNDELAQGIETYCPDCPKGPYISYYPGILNVYPTYKLQSPAAYTGSLAFVFGQNGLLSVDYTFKDYSDTKFNPDRDFTEVNREMSNVLQGTSEVRVGGEYRVENVSFRGGYRYEQSPYKNGKTIGDLQGFSGGIGFNFGFTKLDLAYSHSERDYNQPFFTTGLTDSAKIKSVTNNISLSLLFEL